MNSTEKAKPVEITWDLSDLYASPEDPAIAADWGHSTTWAKDFEARHKGHDIAALSPEIFLQAIQEYEVIQEEGLKPFLYASLLFSEDTQNQQYKTLMQRAKERWNELENQLLFFRLTLIDLPEEGLQKFLQAEPLKAYGHALTFLRRLREFTQGEKEEEILSRKNMTGKSAFITLFDEYTGSFIFRLTVDGEEKELTGSEMLAFLYSPDRKLRESAFRLFLDYHRENHLVLASIFNALILDARVEDTIRGYKDPMQQSLLENEIGRETVDLMMQVTEAHYPLAQEYFQAKACLLGLSKLKNSDLYAPLPGLQKKFSFAQTQDLLLKSFHQFHPLFGEIAGEFIEKRWVDAAIRKGKAGGAFCAGLTPPLHPYLLMNFTGHLRDALTLAHEMGHGIHFYLARKQTLLNFDPSLLLAETASVFGEMVMIQALLQEETDLAARQALLAIEIEDI
ncbi:MAG: M3 family metallopeptidase, partial [Deltaproteobacteria bacterium]|nr:M3 family metallopeptidase [Deltaproteobacteria bacterium]